MSRAKGGFTIVELMISLAISAVMLTGAITVFSTRRQTTAFTQAVYDLQSQIESHANQVNTKAIPGFQQYSCSMGSNNKPVVNAGGGSGETCIYLGEAIQVIPGGDTIYAYPVFGFRTIHNGAIDTGQTPTTPAEASAEPAINSSGGYELVEPYSLLSGLTVVSSNLVGNASAHNLLTFYSSLQNNNTSGNQLSVATAQKSFTSADVKADSFKACIESGCSLKPLVGGNTWQLCVADTGNRQAQLRVKATSTGIATSVNMDGCPAS